MKNYQPKKISNNPNWKTVKLEDIGYFNKGKGISKSEEVNKGLPCIRYGQIYTTYNIKIEKLHTFITKKSSLNSTRIRKEDIIFAGSGEALEEIGKSVVLIKDVEVYVGSDTIILSLKDTANINSLFLTYLLNSPETRRQLNKLGQGNSIVHIYKKDIKKINVRIPPLKKQKKIVEILSIWDQAIEKLEKLISAKEKQFNWLLKNLINDQKDNPQWKTVKLGDICEFTRGPFGSSLKKDIFVKKGYAVYEQFHAIYQDLSKFRYFIDEKKFNNMQRFKVQTDDLIMSCSGTIGKTIIIPKKYNEGIINQALLKLSPKEKISIYFLKLVMDSNRFKNQLFEVGGAIKNVPSVKNLKNIKILLPPLPEQKKIVEILSTWDQVIEKLENLSQLYQKQKKGLMQQILTEKESEVIT